MKKLLIGLLLATTFTCFAGTIENRQTGDTLEFTLDRAARTVEVVSTSPAVSNQTLYLSSIKKRHVEGRVLPVTEDVCEALWGDPALVVDDVVGTCLFLPVSNIPGLAALAVDIVILPLRLPILLFKSMKYNKDFRKLKRAINTEDTTRVSSKRFERIEQLLNQRLNL